MTDGSMSEAEVGAIFQQTFKLMGSVGHLIALLQQLTQGLACVRSAVNTMERVPAIRRDEGRTLDIAAFGHDIAFESIGFRYSGRPDDNVLRNFSCCIPAGKMTALVGHSGSGKSTVGLLLQRLYDPHDGIIRLGGIDLRTVSPSSLRRGISHVEQEPRLFQGTIRDNIRYGHHVASDAEVEAAADCAGVTDFSRALPEGLDTWIGISGKGISGGQKQRVAIARALVKTPQILILDEATSALDVVNEHKILSAIAKRLQHSTVIVIAHRLSTVRHAEQIIVMQQGSVVEVGSHSALCGKNGSVYARWLQNH